METGITLTDDERDLILKMREWKDGIPDGALGHGEMSGVYLSLLAARAELYVMAIRHGHNDLVERHKAFMKLVSPHDIIRLVSVWQKHKALLADLEEREMEVA